VRQEILISHDLLKPVIEQPGNLRIKDRTVPGDMKNKAWHHQSEGRSDGF
jgi:hypothetical protein